MSRKHNYPRRRMPADNSRVRERAAKAGAMAAQGMSVGQIAKTFGVWPSAVYEWRVNYSGVWDAAYDAVMKQVAEVVKRAAGTSAIFKIPVYLRVSLAAKDWAEEHGKDLFSDGSDKLTLRKLYVEHYRPKIMAPDAGDAYRDQFVGTLRVWEVITGDPPLQKITNDTLALFRDALCQLSSWLPGRKLSPNTVRTRMHYVQRLLDAAGPPSRSYRCALGLIPAVPWVKSPRPLIRTPKVVDLEVLGKVYRAADLMRFPKIDGIVAADWWKALLVLAYNTGLRRRTLFSLPMSAVDWKRRLLDIPAEVMKARRGEIVHLNPTAFDHLAKIRGDRTLVFPWVEGVARPLHAFNASMHRLQDLAGIPRKDQFGLHQLRKTCGSMLVRHSAAAAQLTLGHADFSTTKRHYICSEGFVAEALDKLPQPSAFHATGT